MYPASPSISDSLSDATARMGAIREKYDEERVKRLRCDATQQYVDFDSTRFPNIQSNRPSQPKARLKITVPAKVGPDQPKNPPSLEQEKFRVLIVGAGFGGLLFATRLLQIWYCVPTEILFVDEAGGFGGVWNKNQYPGLVCDTESYVYMPLLEETGYKPTQKYVSGRELQGHAELIAKTFGFESQARFESSVKSLTWDEDNMIWRAAIHTKAGIEKSVQASFVYMATGLMNTPKVPRVVGEGNFEGHVFHASRWDYQYTGGTRYNPKMTKLKNKTIGVIGTGASAVQVIPQLAKWAGNVYVFQRTPSAVAPRDNCPTTSDWWDETILKKGNGWQRRRMENFNSFLSNDFPLPSLDHVNDEWSKIPSYSCLVGGENNFTPEYFNQIQELDAVRMNRIRGRVDSIVSDTKTGESLKPWYYGWCKRPCFSDEYLTAFNEPNVTLVDTDGKGVEALTRDGILAGAQHYKLDAVVLCTGYHLGGSFHRGRMLITGRQGRSLQEKWQSGIATLHGVMTNGFPNLFFPGPYQVGASGNQMYALDILAQHVAFIIAHSDRKRYEIPDRPTFNKVSVEPTSQAETAWGMQVAMRAGALQAMKYCTPGYLNNEGSIPGSSDEQFLAAKAGIWGSGANHFARTIEAWRETPHVIVEELTIQCRY